MAHDVNSGSGAAVAAAGHSHVVDMPQLDASSRSADANDKGCHVVINIDAGNGGSTGSDDDIPSCVVCMEPLEWVAIGYCGHRVVCSACAARVRSAPNSDHRCSICRTLCPTVIVTKVAAVATDGVPTLSKMPATFQDGRVGEYWYCAAMTAYFDDERQYEATAKAAAATSLKQHQPPSIIADDDESLRRQGADDNNGASGNESEPMKHWIFAIFLVLCGACIGIGNAVEASGWGQGVAIVLGCTAMCVALGSVKWFLDKIDSRYCGQQDVGSAF